jgi:ferritin-like protein
VKGGVVVWVSERRKELFERRRRELGKALEVAVERLEELLGREAPPRNLLGFAERSPSFPPGVPLVLSEREWWLLRRLALLQQAVNPSGEKRAETLLMLALYVYLSQPVYA